VIHEDIKEDEEDNASIIDALYSPLKLTKEALLALPLSVGRESRMHEIENQLDLRSNMHS